MTWLDWLFVVEFVAILYIALEDYRIRRLEEKSLDIDKLNYVLYKDFFDARTKWYQARGRRVGAGGADAGAVDADRVPGPSSPNAAPGATGPEAPVAATASDADIVVRPEVPR